MLRRLAGARLHIEELSQAALRNANVVIEAMIALKVALLFVLAWTSRFVMDEFVQLGWAKYLGHGLFETVWHPKAVGYVVFFKLAHLIGWDARSILLAGRIETAVLGCATLAIIYACARELGESRVRALAIVLVLLSFSNFIERIFRTIAEPLAVFFAAAALLVTLRGRPDRPRTLIFAGLLSGLAFLATQKSLYFNAAMGLALVADAALKERFLDGIRRGAWLVFGWLIAIAFYCFIFGGLDPIPIARNLVFGPIEVAAHGADAYRGLRQFVVQTLSRNALLYAFCFAGLVFEAARFLVLDERKRIALVFTCVVTALVFAHNQPWPYVFIMALPFTALWALVSLDRVASDKRISLIVTALLGIGISMSFVRNITFLRFDNTAQLELVARGESMIRPDERYFDGIGMLPNRPEPSTLWLDSNYVLKTLREGRSSEAYRIFADSPPKIILWSYRMDSIHPVVAPLIDNSYVQVAPNLRVAGRRLDLARPVVFNVPIAGDYRLYSESGEPLQGTLDIDGVALAAPVALGRGSKSVTLRSGPSEALLLPEGPYAAHFKTGGDNSQLFANVYD